MYVRLQSIEAARFQRLWDIMPVDSYDNAWWVMGGRSGCVMCEDVSHVDLIICGVILGFVYLRLLCVRQKVCGTVCVLEQRGEGWREMCFTLLFWVLFFFQPQKNNIIGQGVIDI